MSRFTIDNDLKIKIQTRLRIDSLKTNSYESSLLYQTDIINNESGFSDICNKIESFKLNAKSIYNWSTKTTTTFNNISNKLKDFAYSSVLDNMLQESRGVRDKIYQASNTVFNNKLMEYNNNYKETTDIENDVKQKLNEYDEYDEKKKNLSRNTQSESLLMSEKNEMQNRINSYKTKMENILIECDSLIKKIDVLNKKNEELVNQYLKRI